MTTLENYLTVAHLWLAEQKADFNPFDGSVEDFLRLQTSINNIETEADGSVMAEDGWIDYAQDNVNTVEELDAEDKERHGDKFDKEEYERSQIVQKPVEDEFIEPKKKTYKFVVPKQIQNVG